MTALLLLLAQAAFAQTVFVPLEAVPVPRPLTGRLAPDDPGVAALPLDLPGLPEALPGLFAAPETPRQTRAALLKVLTDDIQWDGAQRRSRNEAARVVRSMMARVPEVNLRRMVGKKVKLVIIPKGKKLTDMPQASYLMDRRTADGRRWSNVRGLADDNRIDGHYHVFVAEENLLNRIYVSGHPPRSLMVHEWSHAIQGHALSKEEDELFHAIYRAVRSAKLKLPDAYAASNYLEFFAEMSVIWFGVWRSKRISRYVGADWIEENIPKLYSELRRLYGPPKKIRPR